MTPLTVYYATNSNFKKAELQELRTFTKASAKLGAVNYSIDDIIQFEFADVVTDEPLKINLVAMVEHKVRSAYRQLLTPCIVEHAGLIIEGNFPGGLTQPMWDELGADGFLQRTGAANQKATAVAVVGFCDGVRVRTFTGITHGSLSSEPRGEREFYWDTIFCPAGQKGATYAEIVERDGLGKKMRLSQSQKAFKALARFVLQSPDEQLFSR